LLQPAPPPTTIGAAIAGAEYTGNAIGKGAGATTGASAPAILRTETKNIEFMNGILHDVKAIKPEEVDDTLRLRKAID